VFVSPAPNGLKDDLLHTGDPCPNRRGLTQLGYECVAPAELLRRLAESPAALLVGERVAELVGVEGLRALPAKLRLSVFDVRALDVPATDVCVGVPTWVERTGTFVNIDGVRGPISAVKAPPSGVRTVSRHVAALVKKSEALR
jgi:hypothetical protein